MAQLGERRFEKMLNYSNVTGNDSAKDYFNCVLHNISCARTIVIANSAINAPLMIISILGNSLVLTAMLRSPSLRSPSIILLCSLAVSDLLVGLVVQPLYIASNLSKIYLLNTTWFMLTFAACGISLCSITTISVDRFLALHYHMRYPAIVTTFRAKLILAIMWITIFLLSGVYYWSQWGYFLLVALGVCLCLKISIYSYIRIYRIVRRQQIQINCQQQAVNLQTENVSSMLQLKKSALNSFLFFIVMVLFYFPMSVAMSLYVITKDWQKPWSFATTAVFMNSAVNPFLYCWRLRELRAAVVKTFRKIFRKQ